GPDPVWRNAFHRKPSKAEAQGYYVFALPSSSTPSAQPSLPSTQPSAQTQSAQTQSAQAQSAQAQSAQTQAQAPPFDRAPDAIEQVTWRTRTLVGDERLTRWKLAIRPDGLTFLDAVVRADAAVVECVEGRSTQRVSATLPKPLDRHLTADEI